METYDPQIHNDDYLNKIAAVEESLSANNLDSTVNLFPTLNCGDNYYPITAWNLNTGCEEQILQDEETIHVIIFYKQSKVDEKFRKLFKHEECRAKTVVIIPEQNSDSFDKSDEGIYAINDTNKLLKIYDISLFEKSPSFLIINILEVIVGKEYDTHSTISTVQQY